MSEKESTINVDIIDLLLIFVRWRRLFVINFLIAVAVSIAIAFLLPKLYTAQTVILPQSSGLASITDLLPKNLAGFAGDFGFGGTESSMYYTILASRKLKLAIARQFNFPEIYEMGDECTEEDLLDVFESMYAVTTREDNAILVDITNKDPELAAAIANSVAENLDNIYRDLVSEAARKNRLYIENRLREATDSLHFWQDSLKGFQQKTRAIDIEEQTAAMIQAAATIKAQQMANEVNFNVLSNNLGADHPSVIQLRQTSQEYGRKYLDIVEGIDDKLFLGMSEIPSLARNYAEILRQAKIYATLIEFIYPQYESARIQELKETGGVQVMDIASTPSRKSKPARKIIILVTVMVIMFLTLILVLFLEFWHKLPAKNVELWNKINLIKHELFHQKRA